MTATARRWFRWVSAIALGTALIGTGVVIDRALLAPDVDEGSHLETSVEEPAGPSDAESDSHAQPDESESTEHSDDADPGDPDVTSRLELTATVLDNIGLTTQIVSRRPVERTLRFPGTIRMHPDGIAVLSTRIQGKVVSVAVAPGDRVRRGQVLARIQSLVPGNTPPTVELTAPITGIVSRRNAIVGDAAQPNKELFRLIDPRRLVAEAQVPEGIVSRVRLQQRARVHRLRDQEQWTGRVSFIGSDADPATRTYPVWIEPSPGTQALPRPGQFVEILLIESRRTALTVPQQAIVEEGPLRFVFVQRGHGFERRLVRTGAEDAENVEILSGVAAGDTVAVNGSYELLLAIQSERPGGSAGGESAPHGH
jgi:multidrug efflux pump subunit AcrA (membrane-fusion protein)